jgi:hypothetical protein
MIVGLAPGRYFFDIKAAGLPDGIFSDQNRNLDKFCRGLEMEDVSSVYGHFVSFTAI